ncbi:hypothetical protein ABW20_dc0101897 [Dactylellina cionopaga]|nr:hypothetical protein ABW20_dc0101897 [Dactylellina cionopaga]
MEELDPYLHQFWGHSSQQSDYLLSVPSRSSSPNPRRRSLSVNPDDILAGFPAGPVHVPQFNHSVYDIDDSIEWATRDLENFMTFFGRSYSPVPFPQTTQRPASRMSGGGCSLATELTLESDASNTLIPEHLVEYHHTPMRDDHGYYHDSHSNHGHNHYSHHGHHGHRYDNNYHNCHTLHAQVATPQPVPDQKHHGYKSGGRRFKGFQIKLVAKPTPTANPRKHKAEEIEDGERSEERASKLIKSTPSPATLSPTSTIASSTNSIASNGLVQFSIVPPELARKGGHGALKELTEEEKRSKALVRQFGGGCFRCRMLNKKVNYRRLRYTVPAISFSSDVEIKLVG